MSELGPIVPLCPPRSRCPRTSYPRCSPVSSSALPLTRCARCRGQAALTPGDPFGRVLAWVWRLDPDRAMVLLADYLAELRDHGYGADEVDPPIALKEVLSGLRYALPHGFPDYDRIVEMARRNVPSLYGDLTV